MIKRAFDLTASAVALTLLSPLLLGVALAIALEDGAPVLFRQCRVGQGGRTFDMLKFRSMVKNAAAQGPYFTQAADPRITRVGRILRRFSLDETPQFWNVFSGDMAIVGPRPALPEEVAAYPARARRRLAVKPGLTGIWQVSGRAEVGFDTMIEMDLDYVRAQSLGLDLRLIARTFGAVLTGRGAY